MYYYDFQIALQEVPGEVSLCFSISGCKLKCKGCHSPYLWKEDLGQLLTDELFNSILLQYKNLGTCVLFMGGEWHEKKLIRLLKLARTNNYKTCLYTGEEQVSLNISSQLNWIKTGEWNEELGGLSSESTNQEFIEIKTNKKLNHLFINNNSI